MPKRSRSGVVSRPVARRRADERERRQVERHDLRAGALADVIGSRPSSIAG